MDPIAEMFAQIRNAQGARHESLVVVYSKIKWAILEILKSRGLIADFRLVEKKNSQFGKTKKIAKLQKIKIELTRHFTDIKRVSRPGRRVYTTAANISRRRRPQSLVILSTSCGVLEGEEARKKGVGGEVIAEIR